MTADLFYQSQQNKFVLIPRLVELQLKLIQVMKMMDLKVLHCIAKVLRERRNKKSMITIKVMLQNSLFHTVNISDSNFL